MPTSVHGPGGSRPSPAAGRITQLDVNDLWLHRTIDASPKPLHRDFHAAIREHGIIVPFRFLRRTAAPRRIDAATPTSLWAAFSPAGQRRRNRRAGDRRRPHFVDRFSSATFILILMLLAASIVDAVLTIQLLRAGTDEVNPLMDGLLDHGIQPFLVIKYALTAGGLPLLLIYPKPLPVRHAGSRGISDPHRRGTVCRTDWLPTRAHPQVRGTVDLVQRIAG